MSNIYCYKISLEMLIIEAISEFFLKKLCTFLTKKNKEKKKEGKNFLKSHYKKKKIFSQKQFGKLS